MRVFTGGIATETNTFAPFPTGMNDFDVVRASDPDDRKDVPSFGAGLNVWEHRCKERNWEYIFSLFASAQPAGTTVRAVYESLRDELLAALEAAMPVDIVLLQLHGAMVAEGYDDCELDLVNRVRDIVGPDVKIGVELDLHCDVNPVMAQTADAIVIFKEYPHVDIALRADELFTIIADAAEGKTNPVMALYDCRMIGMYLTPIEPMRSYVDEMQAIEGKDGVLSVSLVHCFPWADIPGNGTYTLVVTDNDREKAAQVAEQLGQKLFDIRHTAVLSPSPMQEALDRVEQSTHNKIVVADQADNAGGGAPSDSTYVLREMLDRQMKQAALGMIWDPIAVQIAKSAGVGASLELRLGGKIGTMSGDPLDLTVTVRGIIDDMTQTWPQIEGAIQSHCGDTVWLECDGIDIIVNSTRSQVLGTDAFTNFGINLDEKKVIVVKSTQHFYAAFGPIASEVIYMAAPGAIAPIFTDIPYTRVDTNKYPFVDDPFSV
ncbi:MAG: M81 family metallopeptidase [Chloroflexota bacterium]